MKLVTAASGQQATPGSYVVYTITITNSATSPADDPASPKVDTMFIIDNIDNTKVEYSFTDGVTFIDEEPDSDLTLGTVTFSDDGGSTYLYTPSDIDNGVDPNVNSIYIPLVGTMAHTGADFSIVYKVRVK
jgi:hypothetical protein